MSLRVFHLVFIVCSTLLAFGFGVWGVYMHMAFDRIGLFLTGVCSLAAGIALVFYGLGIAKKFKELRLR